MKTDAFKDRLKIAMGNTSIRSFADQCEISEGTMRRYLNGDGTPTLDKLKVISDISGYKLAWLAEGEGPMRRGEESPNKPEGGVTAGNAKLLPFNQDDFVVLKVHAMTGAGLPQDAITPEAIAEIVIPKEFHRPSILPVQVRGESMHEVIKEGAYVGIDTADKKIVSGKIYAIWLPYEGMTIKRLYMGPDKVICRSDNPNFPEFSIPLNEVSEPFIQGRVKWVVQSL